MTDKISQIIIKIIKEGEKKWTPEVILIALQCLEACTAIPKDDKSSYRDGCLENCAKIFISYLNRPKITEDLVHVKVSDIILVVRDFRAFLNFLDVTNLPLRAPKYHNSKW